MATEQQKALKYIRQVARDNGYIFRDQGAYVNHKKAFMFTEGPEIKLKNLSFWDAYELCVNGSIDKLE